MVGQKHTDHVKGIQLNGSHTHAGEADMPTCEKAGSRLSTAEKCSEDPWGTRGFQVVEG